MVTGWRSSYWFSPCELFKLSKASHFQPPELSWRNWPGQCVSLTQQVRPLISDYDNIVVGSLEGMATHNIYANDCRRGSESTLARSKDTYTIEKTDVFGPALPPSL